MKAEVGITSALFFYGVFMGTITGIEMNKSKTRANLFVDGSFAFSVCREIAVDNNLKTGLVLDEGLVFELKREDEKRRCFNAACLLLGYRPRGEAELKQRLVRKGFGSELVSDVTRDLKSRGWLDDEEFARFWTENRREFKPQSAALIRRELKQKGVGADIIEQAVAGCDDYQSAWQAARPRASKSAGLDYDAFRRRIGGFLQRRGFGYGIIKPVIEKLWQEINTEKSEL
ncbi:MAG: regulatory protein RecX [Dehalococcoidaceae bacterium]|nr:regulatory protein RecX [Dehalococcoidaceae bacterium]